jgi:predicted site-specific integrase-resolvase
MEYIKASAAAKKWGVSKPCVYRAAKEGRIPGAEFIDGYWYIPEDAEDPTKKLIQPKPGYISVREAAEKWGITMESVRAAANEGRIPGAEYIGGRWHIPEALEGPLNKKTERLPGYTSLRKTAEKWGVSWNIIYKAVTEGRSPGAEFIDGKWHIPEDLKNPLKMVMEPKPGYISTREAAKKWDVPQTSVCRAAQKGRIPGAEYIGGRWHIPESVETPLNAKKVRKPGHTSIDNTAEKWGVSRSVVSALARAGRIPGAEFIDGKWHIPEDAVRPTK